MRKLTGMTLVETRLAAAMLTPALLIVFAIIIFPVLADFWISFKPVQLGDLRPASPQIRGRVIAEPSGDEELYEIQYRMRNTSQNVAIENVGITIPVPAGLRPVDLPDRCSSGDSAVSCTYELWDGGFTDSITIRYQLTDEYSGDPSTLTSVLAPEARGTAPNVLTDFTFTLDNYRLVLSGREFWPAFWVTVVYTLLSSLGAIILGLFAAQLLNQPFRGRGLMRGLLLFPYVAPVISLAFTWRFFLDPFSGTLNALLLEAGAIEQPIPFLSQRLYTFEPAGLPVTLPLALLSVILFESWRYFPFAFLFILSRLQAIDEQLYENAELDGASPFQKFWYITIPQLWTVLSTLFLLRFMWTFNKFDDVFLLTGGAAGTETLPIQVYDNAFGRADIGAGAATSVVLFLFLAVFLTIYFTTIAKEEE